MTRRTASTEFRCVICSYGISVIGDLPVCPMCRESVWEYAPERAPLAERGDRR